MNELQVRKNKDSHPDTALCIPSVGRRSPQTTSYLSSLRFGFLTSKVKIFITVLSQKWLLRLNHLRIWHLGGMFIWLDKISSRELMYSVMIIVNNSVLHT